MKGILAAIERLDSLKINLEKEGPLTTSEVAQLIRSSINSEYEAIATYQKIADKTEDPIVKKVMLSVMNEELIHAGEFIRLLYHISPNEDSAYQKGFEEVEKMIKEEEVKQSSTSE